MSRQGSGRVLSPWDQPTSQLFSGDQAQPRDRVVLAGEPAHLNGGRGRRSRTVLRPGVSQHSALFLDRLRHGRVSEWLIDSAVKGVGREAGSCRCGRFGALPDQGPPGARRGVGGRRGSGEVSAVVPCRWVASHERSGGPWALAQGRSSSRPVRCRGRRLVPVLREQLSLPGIHESLSAQG